MNIRPQHETDRRNSKIVYVLMLMIVGAVMYVIGDNSHDNAVPTVPGIKTEYTTAGETVPMCELEDGSTQEVCWWSDPANGRFLNINFGQFVWVPQTGDMINWKE